MHVVPQPFLTYASRIKRYVESLPEGTQPLHGPQREAMLAFSRAIMDGDFHIYTNMPTGSGKMRLLAATIVAMTADNTTPPNIVAAFMRRDHIKKFKAELALLKPEWKDRGFIGEYHGLKKDFGTPITITTPESLVRGTIHGRFSPDQHKTIFLDEVHHFLSERRIKHVMETYPKALLIGATASPHFSAEKTADSHFRCVYHLSPLDAVRQGIIAPFTNHLVMLRGTSLDSVPIVNGDYNQKDLARLTDHAQRYEQIAKFIDNWHNPVTGKPLFGEIQMGYVGTIKQAENAAAFLNKYFHRRMKGKPFAHAVHSGLTDSELDYLYESFQNGEFPMAITPQKWEASFDNPLVSAVTNITGTTSQRKSIQRNRGGRLNEKDPGKHNTINDMIDQSKVNKTIPYGYAIGSASFHKNSDIPKPVDLAAMNRAIAHYWQDAENLKDGAAPRVFEPDKLIVEYADRVAPKSQVRSAGIPDDQELLELIPAISTVIPVKFDRPFNDPMLKSVRDALNREGYTSIRQMYVRYLRAFDLQPEQAPSYHDLLRLAKGSVFRWESAKPSADVLVFEKMLNAPAKEIFASHGAHISNAEDDYDISSSDGDGWPNEFALPKIARRMKKLGYGSLEAVIRAIEMEYGQRLIIKPDHLAERIRGTRPVVQKTWGGDMEIPHDVKIFCQFLGGAPEDLFSEEQYFDMIKLADASPAAFKLCIQKDYERFQATQELPAGHRKNKNHEFGHMVTQAGSFYGGGNLKPPRSNALNERDLKSLVLVYGRYTDFTPVQPQHPPRWATWVKPEDVVIFDHYPTHAHATAARYQGSYATISRHVSAMMPSLEYLPVSAMKPFTSYADDPILPSLRRAMKEAKITSIREIYDRYMNDKSEDWFGVEYDTLLNLARGAEVPTSSLAVQRDIERHYYSEGALIFSSILKKPVKELFADHKSLRSDKSMVLQGDHETRMGHDTMRGHALPAIRDQLKEQGYNDAAVVMRVINMELGFTLCEPEHMLEMAHGTRPIVRKIDGEMRVAPEVLAFCEFLKSTPEILFAEDQYDQQLQMITQNPSRYGGTKKSIAAYALIEDHVRSSDSYAPVKAQNKSPEAKSLVIARAKAGAFPAVKLQSKPRWLSAMPVTPKAPTVLSKRDVPITAAQMDLIYAVSADLPKERWPFDANRPDPMIPELRKAMARKGFTTIRQLFNKNCDVYKSLAKPSYHRMLWMAMGADVQDTSSDDELTAFISMLESPPYTQDINWSGLWRGLSAKADKKNFSDMRFVLPQVSKMLNDFGAASATAAVRAINMEMGYNALETDYLEDMTKGAKPIVRLSRGYMSVAPEITALCALFDTKVADAFEEKQYFEHVAVANEDPIKFGLTGEMAKHARNPRTGYVVMEGNMIHPRTFEMPENDSSKGIVSSLRKSLMLSFRALDYAPNLKPQTPPRWATWKEPYPGFRGYQ